jgi:hypothetical protein
MEIECCVPPLCLRRKHLLARTFVKLLNRPAEDTTTAILQVKTGKYRTGYSDSFMQRATASMLHLGISGWKLSPVPVIGPPPWTSHLTSLDLSFKATDVDGANQLFYHTLMTKYEEY